MYVDALWIRKEGGIDKGELDTLLEEIQLNTGVPIALDGIYRWLVFLPSRQNENRSVPNRFFGAFEDGSLKIRGIAARRGDTPSYIAGVQDCILKMLADWPDPAAAIPDIIQYLQQSIRLLKAGRVPVHELLVSQRLGRKLDAYTTLPAAARAALQLEGIGKHLRPGQRVRFVYTRLKDGVYAWDLGKAPDPAIIDVDQYIKLLIRANSEILQPWVGSEKDLAARLFASGGQLALPRQPRAHPALHASQPPANPCVALAIIRTM
jgi:DNA polymerase-2